ncbi:MAG: CotH kinase family protein [Spirochaetales bacterium]|nr:CotH kinase family protein [Candidatus Physcosoma equi]
MGRNMDMKGTRKGLVTVLILFVLTFLLPASPAITLSEESVTIGTPITASLCDYPEDSILWEWNGVESRSTYTPTPNDAEAWITVAAYSKETKELLASNRLFCSTLPVLYIETEENKPVTSRDYYLPATMRIQGNGEKDSSFEGNIQIKGRGTSSWHYEKKPYKLKLEKKADLFGFGKSKHYVLLASYLDPSLMRNALAFDLSSYLGLVTPDYQWVDLVFNGEYQGAYILMEHVRIGENLVDIYDWKEPVEDAAKALYKSSPASFPQGRDALEEAMERDLSWITTGIVLYEGEEHPLSGIYTLPEDTRGGYLFELGFNKEKEASHFTTKNGIIVGVSQPEYLSSNPTMMEEAVSLFQDYEDAVRNPDGYNDSGRHYTELADLDSMVSYWLTMEILSNEDAAGRSRFAYADKDGILRFGPVWDFDIATGAFRTFFPKKGWNVTATVSGWYLKQDLFSSMVDDPLFQTRARETYWKIRSYLETLISDGGTIDHYRDLLYEAGVANEILWTEDGYMTRTFSGENGDVAYLKAYLKERLQWLDKVFSSRESLEKSLSHLILAENRYVSSSKVELALQDGILTGDPHEATYLLSGTPVLSGKVPRCDSIQVSINGLHWKNVTEEELQRGLSIPLSLLDETHQNTVEGKVVKGTKIYRNYLTVGIPASSSLVLGEVEEKDHHLMKVTDRVLTSSQFGLVSSYYCTQCHQYFQDPKGTLRLDASSVVMSPWHCTSPGGIQEKLRWALLAVSLGLVLLLVGILFLVRWIRKRRSNKRARD